MSQDSKKTYPAVSRSKQEAAVKAFTHAHEMLFGKPSGKLTINLQVSNDPRDWCYHGTQSSDRMEGPPTPLQILGLDKSPEDRNIVTLTNVTVEACISSHWTDEFPSKPWEMTVLRESNHLIVLGAEPIEPIEPADATWRLHLVHKEANARYCGQPFIRHCLALGSHAVITVEPTDLNHLIHHLKKTAQSRFQGEEPLSSKPIGFVIADEVKIWGANTPTIKINIF